MPPKEPLKEPPREPHREPPREPKKSLSNTIGTRLLKHLGNLGSQSKIADSGNKIQRMLKRQTTVIQRGT